MEKAPDAFRTISEVAELLQVPTHVLRFWETRFPQIRPIKRAGGRRYYRPTDVALLAGIRHLLHDQGMTIRGVQRILREQGVQHVCTLAAPVLAADAAVEWAEMADPIPVPPDPPADSERVIAWPGPAAALPAPRRDGRSLAVRIDLADPTRLDTAALRPLYDRLLRLRHRHHRPAHS